MLLRGANAVGYTNYPDNLDPCLHQPRPPVDGIDVFRVFDSLNWLPGMEIAMDEVLQSGQAAARPPVCYTGDILDPDARPIHTSSTTSTMAKELEQRRRASAGYQGHVRPAQALRRQEAGAPPSSRRWASPSTCTPTTPPATRSATYLMAAEAGVDIVDTAIDPHVLHSPASPP
ncbi:MAG: hypothetical protein ACLSHG_08960 [Oscillospiraceae bacterium]